MNVYDKIMRYGLYGWLEGTDRQDNGNAWFVDGNDGCRKLLVCRQLVHRR